MDPNPFENASTLDNFALEDIPPKMILIDPNVGDDIHLIAYHAGKCYVLDLFI
jgi:hypothetical protein